MRHIMFRSKGVSMKIQLPSNFFTQLMDSKSINKCEIVCMRPWSSYMKS